MMRKGAENMAYVALYRKWRPKTFPDLVGQEHVSRTLSQAVETGRVGHAYLFSGPRGTGKTSTAKILAKALNCEKGPSTEPCNECESCRRVNDGTSMDVFEIDAASNRGIDEIRDLRETVKFAPANGKYKVYIIDEVHMLTSEAFNALLKTLEEPPERVVFILATTEVHKVPATIQSRCQRYDFKRISVKNIAERLRYVADHSEISADDEALSLIARESAGGMRDALSTLDQCASLAEEKVSVKVVQEVLGLVGHDWVVRILKAVSQKDAAEALKALGELLQEGKDLRQLVGEMIAELRSLMVFQAVGSTEGVELYETSEETLKEGASFFSPDDFAPMLDRLHEALTELRWTSEPRIAVETALLALCRPRAAMMTASPGETVPVQQGTDSVRIAQLEAKLQALSSALAARSQQAPVIPAGNMPAAGTGAAAVQPSAPVPGGAFKMTDDGKTLWQALLANLMAEEKYKLIGDFLARGQFGGITQGAFRVFMRSPFLVRRLESDDYKQLVESRLALLAGRPMRLVCETAADLTPQAPRPMPKKKKEEKSPIQVKVQKDMETMTPDERKQMDTAMAVFGSNFVPLPEGENGGTGTVEPEKEAPLPPDDDIPLPTDDDAPLPNEDELPPLPPEE